MGAVSVRKEGTWIVEDCHPNLDMTDAHTVVD